MRILKAAVVLASAAWVLSLPLAALAASGPRSTLAYGFAFVIYGIGSLVCHQRPDRSFHLWMVALPVCARCTGIYAGGALAAMATVARVLPAPARIWPALTVSVLPALATLVYEWTTGSVPANWTRAASGALLGLIAGVILVSSLQSRPACDAPPD